MVFLGIFSGSNLLVGIHGEGGLERILPDQLPSPFTVNVQSYVTGVVYFRQDFTKIVPYLFPQLIMMDSDTPMIVMAMINRTQSFGRVKILILEVLDNLKYV